MPTPGPPCPQCRCRPGFRLKDDGRTCADVDECSTTFPCSQRCINTHGSYKCLCVEGYAPRGGDPHSCKAVTGETGAWGVQLAQATGQWQEDWDGRAEGRLRTGRVGGQGLPECTPASS